MSDDPHDPGVVRLERLYVVDGERGRGTATRLVADALGLAFTPIPPYTDHGRPLVFLGCAVSGKVPPGS